MRVANNYQQGYLDFSASPLTFDRILIDWRDWEYYTVCEIFAFAEKNLVPEATITKCFNSWSSSNRGDGTYWQSNYEIVVLYDENPSNFKSNNQIHTCVYGGKRNGSADNILVVDFASTMIITDIFNAGGKYKMQFYAVDPSSAAMGLTACGLRDAVHNEGK